MNEFEHVYVGYFIDISGGTHVETTMNPALADHWKSLNGHIATEEVVFRIPEEILSNGQFDAVLQANPVEPLQVEGENW